MRVWLLKYFIKYPAKDTLNSRTTHKVNNTRTDGKWWRYCAIVSHLLKKFATDDVIYDVKNDLFKF